LDEGVTKTYYPLYLCHLRQQGPDDCSHLLK
jgi:hypothetical protein